MGHTWNTVSHLAKSVTLGKMCHACKNESRLEKLATLGKMSHTWKNGSYFQKCVTLGKMFSHLEKFVTLHDGTHRASTASTAEKW